MSRVFRASLVLAATLIACGDVPRSLPSEPALAQGGAAACPMAANVVVVDETGLLAALGAAVPGDVIGIDGTVVLSDVVPLATPGVTLTCATPGAGFAGAVGFPNAYLLNVVAPDVAIDRLLLDGSGLPGGAITSTGAADRIHFTRNHVLAGGLVGAFFVGTRDAVVTDNLFEATAPTGTGLHMQNAIHGSTIAGNTVRTLVPSGHNNFGAIRVRDGQNVTLADNSAEGAWTNGFSLTNLQDTEVSGNRSEGARHFGFATSFGGGSTLVRRMVVRNNRFTATGTSTSSPPLGFPPAGVLLMMACDNTFIGNNLNGNFGDVGAVLSLRSGANTMNGNRNVVFDDGDFDCDGDGSSDPNGISGKSLKGGFGAIISDAASNNGGPS